MNRQRTECHRNSALTGRAEDTGAVQAGMRATVRHPRETADQAVAVQPRRFPRGAAMNYGFSLRPRKRLRKRKKELYAMLHDSDGKDTVVIYISSVKAMKRLPENYSICIEPEIVNNLTKFLGKIT